jgi:hypothetical protein
MDKLFAAVYLILILLGALSFSYLLVKSAESELPSHVTSMIASMVKQITNYRHKERKVSDRGKDIINNCVCLDAHLEKRFKGRVRVANFINSRNKQNNTRRPKS